MDPGDAPHGTNDATARGRPVGCPIGLGPYFRSDLRIVSLTVLVGVTGYEPTTPRPRVTRASKLRYTPSRVARTAHTRNLATTSGVEVPRDAVREAREDRALR